MKILLLTPPYSIKERYNSKTDIKQGYLPPLGLAYIATFLEKEGEHEVQIIDLQVEDYTLNELIKKIKEFKPSIMGFSALTPTVNRAFSMAKEIKKAVDTPIIFGGAHVSCFPKETLENEKQIDIVVIKEGEHAMKEIAEYFEGRRDISSIKGIAYRNKNGGIEMTSPREMLQNLDDLPIPERKYFDMSKYIPLPNQYKRKPITNMITTRGCSYGKCTYCFEAGRLGHKYRRISPQRAIEEIEYLVKNYHVKEIDFWDDEFVFDKRWVEEFCGLIIAKNIDICWSCYARVNFVNKEILKKMADAGCWNIFYGLESGNQELLNKIKKGITLEQSRNAVKWANEAGIETRGSFMLALPGETPEMGKKTINFAVSLGLDYAQFLLTTPFPGTELFEQCKQEGRLSKNYDDYSVFKPVFIPNGYKNEKEITKLHKLAYRKFYLRPSYAMRHLKKIKTWTDVKKYAAAAKFIVGMS